MKKILYPALFIALLVFIFLVLQSTYLSGMLSELIIPELEEISGKKISVEKFVLHLFPLSVEARGIQISGERGNIIAAAGKMKAYVRASALLYHKLAIQRLAIHNPDIGTDNKELDEIIKHIEAYLKQNTQQKIKVTFKVIEVINGNIRFRDKSVQGIFSLANMQGEFAFGHIKKLTLSAQELSIEKKGWPLISSNINASLQFTKDGLEIKRLHIGAFGSVITSQGFYSKGKGNLRAKVALIVDSIKRIFNLGRSGSGDISANGEIKLIPQAPGEKGFSLKNILLDVQIDGAFYIQTLMELLKVRERIEGLIDVKGKITGPLSDISGKASAHLKNGNLFNVAVDSLDCDITYREGIMKFENGSAKLYGGTAQANAQITLPVVSSYVLNVTARSADSRAVLKLIGWEPDIPVGTVDGELSTAGKDFNPRGKFVYKAHSPISDNVIDRIQDIQGDYRLNDGILSFANMQLNTSQSNLTLNGTIDLPQKTLNFAAKMYTRDIADLMLPFYSNAHGQGTLAGNIAGTYDDPLISLIANLSEVTVEKYKAATTRAEFSYRKNLLSVREAVFSSPGEEHHLKGLIRFPKAQELFQFSSPEYNLSATLNNADFEQTARIFYENFRAEGQLAAVFTMKGTGENFVITGQSTVKDGAVYDIPFDSFSTDLTYTKRNFIMESMRILKGRSVLQAEGAVVSPDQFSYKITSDRLYLNDIGLRYMPDDALISLQSQGEGTFGNPVISANAKVLGGTFKGRDMGAGSINATIHNKNILVDAVLFHEKVLLKGQGVLTDAMPWDAELTVQQGRYDFIISSLLKDVPEDLQLNLEGKIRMSGDKDTLDASAAIKHLSLALFGQTFMNDSDIVVHLHNGSVSVSSFIVRSGATAFELKGGMEIGKKYDLLLNGSSALAPLKGFSEKIGYLKGDADFVFSVTGPWEKPEINGGMNVADATFGLRDYPAYISSINGYLYIDGDRIVLEKLTGKIGGGDVACSGHIDLKAFHMKRFYMEGKLENITAVLSKDFNINFNGELVYKGTSDKQSITGDIFIKRAKYKEMVGWRSWLLKAKATDVPKVEEPALRKTDLNIRISGSENIAIDNNIARAPIRIRGDLIVRGPLTNPVLFGRLESSEGFVYFRNNEFRIIYASADFADPNRIKPVINLAAETTVQGYDIRLNLEGQFDRFSLALSSDPHLEEVDILSLLAVGQVGKQLKGLEGGIGAGQATSFLTGKAQDVIEERLRTLTGLDRFQVEPYVSKTTGTVEPRVTVSERLIGDRLFVTYATSLSSTEEEILKLEYPLNKHISLIGVKDERDSLGGDIKFRFEFK